MKYMNIRNNFLCNFINYNKFNDGKVKFYNDHLFININLLIQIFYKKINNDINIIFNHNTQIILFLNNNTIIKKNIYKISQNFADFEKL